MLYSINYGRQNKYFELKTHGATSNNLFTLRTDSIIFIRYLLTVNIPKYWLLHVYAKAKVGNANGKGLNSASHWPSYSLLFLAFAALSPVASL